MYLNFDNFETTLLKIYFCIACLPSHRSIGLLIILLIRLQAQLSNLLLPSPIKIIKAVIRKQKDINASKHQRSLLHFSISCAALVTSQILTIARSCERFEVMQCAT